MSGYLKTRDDALQQYKLQSQQAMNDTIADIKKATDYAIQQNKLARDQNIRDLNAYDRKVKSTDVYNQGLNKALGGAASAGQAQAANAQSASRAAGMSKSAAAEAAKTAANQGFNNALSQQQGMAMGALDTQLGREGQNVAQKNANRWQGAQSMGGTALGSASQLGGQRQYGAEAQAKIGGLYNQAYRDAFNDSGDIAGRVIDAGTSAVGLWKDIHPSDANTKDLVKNNEDSDPFDTIDALLKKHYKGGN